ncbi:MAG: DUF3198 domain-containing protein [Candidatus Thermoplasmatota archaeon]
MKIKKKLKNAWSKIELFIRDYMHIISFSFLGISVFAFILGVLGFWFEKEVKKSNIVQLKEWINYIGYSDICFLIIGFIVLCFAGYYFGENILNRRKFKKLVTTASKEKFIKNLDKIEELAYRLSTKHENIVVEKKKKFNIKV